MVSEPFQAAQNGHILTLLPYDSQHTDTEASEKIDGSRAPYLVFF